MAHTTRQRRDIIDQNPTLSNVSANRIPHFINMAIFLVFRRKYGESQETVFRQRLPSGPPELPPVSSLFRVDRTQRLAYGSSGRELSAGGEEGLADIQLRPVFESASRAAGQKRRRWGQIALGLKEPQRLVEALARITTELPGLGFLGRAARGAQHDSMKRYPLGNVQNL